MTDYIQKSVKRTFYVLIFTFLAALAGYFTRMFLARAISPEEFGLFYSVFTLFMFISIFTDMGYNQSIVKYIPEFIVKKNKKAMSKLIKYVINVNIFLTLMISMVILFLSKIIATKYLSMPDASSIIILCVLMLLLNNIVSFVQVLFQAFQDMFKYGLFYFFSKILFFICTIFLFYIGFSRDVTLPLWAYIGSCVLVLFAFGYSAYKLVIPRIKNRSFDKKMFVKITHFALPNMISTIAGTVIGYIDTIILTLMAPLSLVGVYNATIATILILGYLGGVIATVLFPLISELNTKKNKKNMNQLISTIYRYSLIIIIPCALVMFFFSEIILRILFGEAFVSGATAMSILSIGVIFLTISQINFSVLNGLGQPKKITIITVVAAIFNTIANLIIIPFLGINGAALTTTISYLIMMTWSYFILRNHIKIKLDKLLQILIASAIFFFSLYYLKKIINTNTYLEVVITLTATIIVYIVSLILLRAIRLSEINSLKNKIIKKN